MVKNLQLDHPFQNAFHIFSIFHSINFFQESLIRSPFQNAENTPFLISVLRLLFVRDNNPEMWSKLDLLMDHVEDQKLKTETWNSTQRNIVNWLLTPDKGGLHERFTTDEINRAIGEYLLCTIFFINCNNFFRFTTDKCNQFGESLQEADCLLQGALSYIFLHIPFLCCQLQGYLQI